MKKIILMLAIVFASGVAINANVKNKKINNPDNEQICISYAFEAEKALGVIFDYEFFSVLVEECTKRRNNLGL